MYPGTDRLGFYLMGPVESLIVFGLNDIPGSHGIPPFPNATDVIVIGCQEKGYIDALAVTILPPTAPGFLSDSGTVLIGASQIKSISAGQVCPLAHP